VVKISLTVLKLLGRKEIYARVSVVCLVTHSNMQVKSALFLNVKLTHIVLYVEDKELKDCAALVGPRLDAIKPKLLLWLF